ncbi:MAG: PKD domain-containing protein [Candidatus Bathyarchaeota archaeon]|nr:PKD domain-containing protein [Candidatus Bathyarchaeota archaeon]
MKKTVLTFCLVVLVSVMACMSIVVYGQITYPSPYWDYSPITPRVGDVVMFDASEFEKTWNAKGESTLVSLVWHFGDGASAAGALVTHRYASPGTYVAGVTATDNRGYGGTSEYEIEVRQQTPVTVYLSLSSDEVYTGQEVTLSGNLTYNGAGVPDAWVSLSSKTYIEGAVWHDIATVKTDGYGKFSAVWKPIHGYYQVRAMWAGNSTYPETSISVILIVKGFGNLITEFSSNSTISGLNFNSTTRVLSFSAEGPSGTSGYVSITLEKDPSFDPHGITVLFDGSPIEYEIDSAGQSWILFFTYAHSSHNITVNLANAAQEPISPLHHIPQETVYGIAVAVAIVAAAGLLVYLRKHKKKVEES